LAVIRGSDPNPVSGIALWEFMADGFSRIDWDLFIFEPISLGCDVHLYVECNPSLGLV